MPNSTSKLSASSSTKRSSARPFRFYGFEHLVRLRLKKRNVQSRARFFALHFPDRADETVNEDGAQNPSRGNEDLFAMRFRQDTPPVLVRDEDIVIFWQEAYWRSCLS